MNKIRIVRLAELIAQEEATQKYLVDKDSLTRLNALVEAHAIVTGTAPYPDMYYKQSAQGQPLDYVENKP